MLFNRKMHHTLRKTMWLARLEPNYDEVPCSLAIALWPVSYTHLTLPTICSV